MDPFITRAPKEFALYMVTPSAYVVRGNVHASAGLPSFINKDLLGDF